MIKHHTAKMGRWIVNLEVEAGVSSGHIYKEGDHDIGSSLAWLFNEGCVYDVKDRPVNVPKDIIERVQVWADDRGW
jgi:hypothetical protein